MTLRIPASLRVYNSAGTDPVTVEFNGSDLPAYNARDAQGQVAPQEATLQSGGNDGKGTGGNTDILHVTTDVYHDGALAKLMYKVSIEGTLPNCTTQDLPIVSFNWGSFSDYASPYYVLRQRSPSDYATVYGGGPTALPFISPQMVTRLWVAGPWGGGADRTHNISVGYTVLTYKIVNGRRCFASQPGPPPITLTNLINYGNLLGDGSGYVNNLAMPAMQATVIPNVVGAWTGSAIVASLAAHPVTVRWQTPMDPDLDGILVLRIAGDTFLTGYTPAGIDLPATGGVLSTSVVDDGSWGPQSSLTLPKNLTNNPPLSGQAPFDLLPWRGNPQFGPGNGATFYLSHFNNLTFNRAVPGSPPGTVPASYATLDAPSVTATVTPSPFGSGFGYCQSYTVWAYKRVGNFYFFARGGASVFIQSLTGCFTDDGTHGFSAGTLWAPIGAFHVGDVVNLVIGTSPTLLGATVTSITPNPHPEQSFGTWEQFTVAGGTGSLPPIPVTNFPGVDFAMILADASAAVNVSWPAVSGADGYFVTKQCYYSLPYVANYVISDSTPGGCQLTGTSFSDPGIAFSTRAPSPGLLANRGVAYPSFTLTVFASYPNDDTCLIVGRLCDGGGRINTAAIAPSVVWYKILDHRMLDQNDLDGLVLDYYDQYTSNPPLALYNQFTAVGLLPLLNKSINRNFAPPVDDWSGTSLKISMIL
jgi:hypothetical protein